ncbi:Hypothetical predicted protein, partial [Paramuricea clavata]
MEKNCDFTGSDNVTEPDHPGMVAINRCTCNPPHYANYKMAESIVNTARKEAAFEVFESEFTRNG